MQAFPERFYILGNLFNGIPAEYAFGEAYRIARFPRAKLVDSQLLFRH
jgi:hypothetical protein